MDIRDPKHRPSAHTPPSPSQPRAYHYPRTPLAKRRRGPGGLIVRLVAIASWAMIILLVIAMVRQLHDPRLTPRSAPPAPTLITPESTEEPAPVAESEPEPEPEPAVIADNTEAPTTLPEPPHMESKPRARAVELVLEPAPNGNFYVEGTINNQRVVFVVDTGASTVAIPDKLRWQLNLTRGGYVSGNTANGRTGMYNTQVKQLSIGPLQLKNVAAVLNPGASDEVVLLGMSALREIRMVQEGGLMFLQQEHVPESGSPAPLVAEPPKAAAPLKKSVKDCMGDNKVINAQVLKCMRGEEEAAEAE